MSFWKDVGRIIDKACDAMMDNTGKNLHEMEIKYRNNPAAAERLVEKSCTL